MRGSSANYFLDEFVVHVASDPANKNIVVRGMVVLSCDAPRGEFGEELGSGEGALLECFEFVASFLDVLGAMTIKGKDEVAHELLVVVCGKAFLLLGGLETDSSGDEVDVDVEVVIGGGDIGSGEVGVLPSNRFSFLEVGEDDVATICVSGKSGSVGAEVGHEGCMKFAPVVAVEDGGLWYKLVLLGSDSFFKTGDVRVGVGG